MNPQTNIKAKNVILILGIIIVVFAVLVGGSYKIGMSRAIGTLIGLYGMVTLIGGIFAIARKSDYKIMKNGTIVITGILAILIGMMFIF